tara:strand:+ start:2234 stop:2374 length:141 start_codon:yes stop_codon:yes gene_type:complete
MKSFKQYISEDETTSTPIVPKPTKVKKKAIKPPVEEPREPIDVDPS